MEKEKSEGSFLKLRSDKGRNEKLLFNFEDTGRYLDKVSIRRNLTLTKKKWGCSSAGRAPALHAGGQEFDPPHLHQG